MKYFFFFFEWITFFLSQMVHICSYRWKQTKKMEKPSNNYQHTNANLTTDSSFKIRFIFFLYSLNMIFTPRTCKVPTGFWLWINERMIENKTAITFQNEKYIRLKFIWKWNVKRKKTNSKQKKKQIILKVFIKKRLAKQKAEKYETKEQKKRIKFLHFMHVSVSGFKNGLSTCSEILKFIRLPACCWCALYVLDLTWIHTHSCILIRIQIHMYVCTTHINSYIIGLAHRTDLRRAKRKTARKCEHLI